MKRSTPRTTIGLKSATKDKLDRNRAPGQCYDGFLCQMVELWELTHSGDKESNVWHRTWLPEPSRPHAGQDSR
jgi:hypothetical protein